MATEVLRPHNVLLPGPQRVRAAHRSANPSARRPAAGRRHQGGRPPAAAKKTAARAPAAEVYAGPAFSTSPEPSALPLPQFPARKAALVDDAATRGLRRILWLE